MGTQVYKVRDPSGAVREIRGPEGATDAEILAQAQRLFATPASTEPAAPAPAAQPVPESPELDLTQQHAADHKAASKGDIIAGLPATRVAMGLASPLIGAAQLGVGIGDKINEMIGVDPVLGKMLAEKLAQYEAAKKRGMAALGDGSTDILGGVGAMATGAAALKGVTPAATMIGKIGQGAVVGAAAGATTPSTTPGLNEQLTQGAIGFGVGAALPPVTELVKMGGKWVYRAVIEPWLYPGAIKGRTYLAATGDRSQEVVNALRAPGTEVVPGALPTASEAAVAAGRPEFSALGKQSEQILPRNWLARRDAVNTARTNNLDLIANQGAGLEATQAARSAHGTINYGVAGKVKSAVTPEMDALMETPAMQTAIATAKRIMENRQQPYATGGVPSVILGPNGKPLPAPPQEVYGESMHAIKLALDKMAANPSEFGINAADVAAVKQVRSKFVTLFEAQNPAYKFARTEFAKESVPINQMEIGQYLKDKLTPALDEGAAVLSSKQKSGAYAQALRDAPGTIKRAVDGTPRFQKLTDMLTPDQMDIVNGVRQDLVRAARDSHMANKGAKAAPKLSEIGVEDLGNSRSFLSRPIMVANMILDRLQGKITKKLSLEIANEMLSPEMAATQIERAIARKQASDNIAAATARFRLPALVGGLQNMNALAGQQNQNQLGQ